MLAGKTSGVVSVSLPNSEFGYGVIEWRNAGNEDDSIALISQGFRSVLTSSSRGDIPVTINNGQPF